MTQTRKEALTDLLAKVKAGNLPREQIAIAAFDVQPDLKSRRTHVVDAFDGSLDAAKALHEAVLPLYTRDVDATAPECGIDVTLHPVDENGASVVKPLVTATSDIEARAWLIAIIKALIAQEPDL